MATTVPTANESALMDEIQLQALSAFSAGKSVALVGGGGSGKSYVLRTLIAAAEEQYGKYRHVVSCALSNKAASALCGTTIHSLFVAKPSWEFSNKFLWKGTQDRPALIDRLRRFKVLFIDELCSRQKNWLIRLRVEEAR